MNRPRGLSAGGMALFASATFSGAFLLFLVQPLIGKYILPWFGGGPAVWTTCMLFFQVLLLGGYAYAHASHRWLTPRSQAWVHLGVLLLAMAMLPIIPGEGFKPRDAANPTGRILLLLAVTVGLPYFALSATSPLLQAWFSRASGGASPYRLYALSNAGSLLSLLAYPFAMEPLLPRRMQAIAWSAGLAVFAALCAACAVRALKAPPQAEEATAPAGRVNPLDGVLWVCLAACASVMLLAATNIICQDVAVVPFLWIVPLALYLLSFILAFDHPRWYFRPLFVALFAAGLFGCWRVLTEGVETPLWQQLVAYCVALFAVCMICHGELARLRPDPRHLTGYYLLISLGGALGGAFVAIAAPRLFPDFYELHLALVGCYALLLAALWRTAALRARRWLAVWVLLVGGLVVVAWVAWTQSQAISAGSTLVERVRSFHGVLSVYEEKRHFANHRYVLHHGNIVHGMQMRDEHRRGEPTSYYAEGSGIAVAFDCLPRSPRRVGVVGLGTGTLALYARPNDLLRFYEIDPQVENLARRHFTYLADCRGAVQVVLGDARLSMEREPNQELDLLALDAFSGDAIPIHLLTRECLEIYLRHLKPDGVIAIHISNHHLDLEPVVYRLADEFALRAVTVDKSYDDWEEDLYSSTWVLVTRSESMLERARNAAAIITGDTVRRGQLWTDDHANLLQILK